MGSQWPGMARGLMKIPVFNDSLKASSKVLEKYGLDVYAMLQSTDPAQYKDNTLNSMLAISSIQVIFYYSYNNSKNLKNVKNFNKITYFIKIALTDVLFELGVLPDGIVGHSTGEMGCGYADGALTRDQTMLLAYHRGTTIMNSKLNIKGAMAAVGLTWEEAQKRCPEGVVPACHNGKDSVTISGAADKVN